MQHPTTWHIYVIGYMSLIHILIDSERIMEGKICGIEAKFKERGDLSGVSEVR